MTAQQIRPHEIRVGDRIVVKPTYKGKQRFAVAVDTVDHRPSGAAIVWGRKLYVDSPMIGNRGRTMCRFIRDDYTVTKHA